MKFVRATAILFLASSAFAGLRPGDHTLSAQLGSANPLSDIDLTNEGGGKTRIGSNGSNVGLQYTYEAVPGLGIGVDLNFSGFGENDSNTFLPRSDSTLSSESLLALAIVKGHFKTSGAVLPYLLAGLGIHSTRLMIDATPKPGYIWTDTNTAEKRNLLDDTQSGFAFAVGLGLDFPVGERFLFGAEARYQFMGDATYSNDPPAGFSGIEGRFAMVALLARIGIKFGGSSATPLPHQAGTAAVEPTPAAPPAPPVSDRQKARDFIISGYTPLIQELPTTTGPYASSLLDTLKVKPADHAEAGKRIHALSVAYPNINDFADHVIEVYPAAAEPAAPTPTPVAEPAQQPPAKPSGNTGAADGVM